MLVQQNKMKKENAIPLYFEKHFKYTAIIFLSYALKVFLIVPLSCLEIVSKTAQIVIQTSRH